MEKQKFTYVIEKLSNNGCIDIQEGERKYKSENLLYFADDDSLIKALKQYKKSILIAYDDTETILIEGERLSKKLGLEFQHP